MPAHSDTEPHPSTLFVALYSKQKKKQNVLAAKLEDAEPQPPQQLCIECPLAQPSCSGIHSFLPKERFCGKSVSVAV